MGGAFSALGDDAFGFYYNPASLGLLRRGQIGADHGKLWLGLDDGSELSVSFFSVAVPFFKTKILDKPENGSSEVNISSSSQVNASTSTAAQRFKTKREHIGSLLIAWRNFALAGSYQESAYYIGWGKSVNDRLAYGFNLKSLQEKYTIDKYLMRSPVFDYGAKAGVSAFSADAGAIYNLLPRLFLGLSVTDLNQPDVGLKEKDQLPMTTRVGIAWKQKDLRWAADAIYRANLWYGAVGLEKWLLNSFAIRGGATIGGLNYVQPSLGFSFDASPFQIDYVFQYPINGIRDVSGSHRMSFIFRFGSKAKEEVEPGSLEYYYAELQEKSKNLESNLKATEAEKQRLEEVLLEEATMRIRERIKAAKSEARESRPADTGPAVKEAKEVRHVVKRGETLQSIAEKYYGDAKFWNEIYQLNRENIGRGGALKPDQVLIIPLASKGEKPAAQEQTPERKEGLPAVQQIEVTPVKVITPQAPAQPAVTPANLPGMTGSITPQPVEVVPIKVITPEKSGLTAPSPGLEVPKAEKKDEAAEIKKPSAEKPAEKPKISGPRKHTVQAGENLRTIAQKYYNDSNKWRDIYKANTSKIVGGQVMPGQEIIIP